MTYVAPDRHQKGRPDMTAAIYARVSTLDQNPDNQLVELRRYCAARGWTAVEFVDCGISGAKDKRPALDQLVTDVQRRDVDVVVCWRLDRLGRNLKHLVTLLETWSAVGVAFVSLGEGIDCTTPAGKLQLHILAALAEFERGRLRERVHAGLDRARREGIRLGRPPAALTVADVERTMAMSVRAAAAELQVPRSVLQRRRRRLSLKPAA
jgi:DNA invertase Pin-like site-specific DNA recombinase